MCASLVTNCTTVQGGCRHTTCLLWETWEQGWGSKICVQAGGHHLLLDWAGQHTCCALWVLVLQPGSQRHSTGPVTAGRCVAVRLMITSGCLSSEDAQHANIHVPVSALSMCYLRRILSADACVTAHCQIVLNHGLFGSCTASIGMQGRKACSIRYPPGSIWVRSDVRLVLNMQQAQA